MERFKAKKHGDKMGCTDTARPEVHSNADLSRIHDVLSMIERVHGEPAALAVWDSLPSKTKMEYNYARWTYVVL